MVYELHLGSKKEREGGGKEERREEIVEVTDTVNN